MGRGRHNYAPAVVMADHCFTNKVEAEGYRANYKQIRICAREASARQR